MVWFLQFFNHCFGPVVYSCNAPQFFLRCCSRNYRRWRCDGRPFTDANSQISCQIYLPKNINLFEFGV